MHLENTFHDLFKCALNTKSGSRPPKIELKGVLLPNNKKDLSGIYKFKLESNSKEYLLLMNEALTEIARRLTWEEVTAKGYLDLETNVFEVEKINRSRINDPAKAFGFWMEPYFEIESYKRAIQRSGKIEPALEELVS